MDKHRLLIMNGRRLLEKEDNGRWQTIKVEPAGLMRPGLYNLFSAQAADPNKRHTGPLIHVDADNVFQKGPQGIVVHPRNALPEKLPALGTSVSVTYGSQGVTLEAEVLTRGRSVR